MKIEKINLQMSYAEAVSIKNILEENFPMKKVKATVQSFEKQINEQIKQFAKDNNLLPEEVTPKDII